MNITREKRKENEGNRRPASGIYSTNHPRATKHLVGAPHFVTAFSPACCLSGLSGRLIGGRKSLRYQLIFITTFKHLDKLINLASANRPDLPNEMENERPGRWTVEAGLYLLHAKGNGRNDQGRTVPKWVANGDCLAHSFGIQIAPILRTLNQEGNVTLRTLFLIHACRQ